MPFPPKEMGGTEIAAFSLPKCSASFILIVAIPPTARTAYTASTMTAVILMTNCTRSVHSTAHMPAATEYAIVMTKQIPTAMTSPDTVIPPICTGEGPTRSWNLDHRATQPRMIRLIGIARYSAKNAESRRRLAAVTHSANSTSVTTFARRRDGQSRTPEYPAHQHVPPEPVARDAVRRHKSRHDQCGVSAAKVVATIEALASHQAPPAQR
jgi:hypothetical protein